MALGGRNGKHREEGDGDQENSGLHVSALGSTSSGGDVNLSNIVRSCRPETWKCDGNSVQLVTRNGPLQIMTNGVCCVSS